MKLSLDNATVSRERVIWRGLSEGLGSLAMEAIQAGSAPLASMTGSALLLMRARQLPHRERVLFDLLAAVKSRSDDIRSAWNAVKGAPVHSVIDYETLVTAAWAGTVVNIDAAIEMFPSIVEYGWNLIEEESLSARETQFCFALTSAADTPDRLRERDLWAFSAFEPIAYIGAKVFEILGND